VRQGGIITERPIKILHRAIGLFQTLIRHAALKVGFRRLRPNADGSIEMHNRILVIAGRHETHAGLNFLGGALRRTRDVLVNAPAGAERNHPAASRKQELFLFSVESF
jgi:hypothetical protein